MARILIVDDEKNVRATVSRALALEGHETVEAADAARALARLDGGGFAAAVVDLSMPGMDGLDLLRELRERGDGTPVIILTAHGTVDTAVRALKLGAYDFLEKPPDRERLLHAISQALEHSRLAREVEDLREDAGATDEIVGTGALMDELREKIKMAAPSDGRILITGENGTGKELVARAVHRLSTRSDEPFVKVNCAAIPESLFESELFGHVRGAFTDARENRKGKFERAHGGTLFLDEVGETPMTVQAKLLRAIETGEVERVGGSGEFIVDVRIIAATNKLLEREIEAGSFRQDLFYRLNVIPIPVPPLRERKQDIPALGELFLAACCRRNGYAAKRVDDAAMELLARHDYPGNVRELRNAMERLAILTPGEEIGVAAVEHVLPEPGTAAAARSSSAAVAAPPSANAATTPSATADGTLRERMEGLERDLVAAMLKRHGWRMAEAARALGLERSHLYKKMKALGISKPKD